VLAVVLIGKGIAALQEAGMISVGVLPGFPRIELLVITPTIQAVSAQLVMFGLLALGFWWSRRETSAP
jgi:high-affinity iron transporter